MNVPQEETISNQSQDNERDEIAKETLLYHLQEMFASQIEPDVVKFTLEDCNFNVNAAIENLLFAAGSDNGGLSSIQPIKRQSPSSSPPSAAAPVKSHHDATDEVIRSQRHGEGEHNDISSVTDSDKVPGVSTDTKYIVDYRDKRESNGMTSFYGNRISTIYKSNEGLYTEDVTNGDELSHPQQPVVISTDKDPANLSCVRGYRDIKVEDCQAPISSLQSWNFQEPPPKRPSSSRSCENYKGRKLPYGGIPEFCPNYTPRRRNWDTTAVCSGGELRDAFSPDSDKSVEADASESFGAYLRPTAVDGRNMNSSVVHKRQVKHPANPNGVGRHGGHPRPHQQQNVSNSTYGRPHSQQSRSFKQQVVARIKKGEKLIVLLRGLPGSGKSTLARELQYHGVILSADDYFIKNGTYEYDPAKLSEAHASSRKLARIAMQQCRTPIIIDNTNMEVWEMLPYVSEAMQFRYGIYCLEPETPWRYDPKVLAQKNSHNVGMNKIVRMLERFDFNVSVEKMARECKALSNHVHHSRPNPTLQQSAVFVRQTSKPPPRRKPAADPGNTISRAQSTKSRRPNMNVENRERHSEKGPAFSEKLQKATSVPNLHQNVPYALDPRNRDVADLIMFDAAPKLDSIPNSSEVQQWNTISSDWDDVAPDNTIVQQKEPTVCYSKIQANDTNLIDFGVLQVNDQPSAQREPAGASQKETLPWNQRTTPRCRGLAASFKDLNLKQNWEIPKYPSSQEVVTKADKCERPTGVEQYQDMSTVGMNLDHSVVSSRGEDDGHFELESTVGSMADLKSYFPMVPDEQLQDIYDKCQGNLHWILDLLLESGYDISHGVLSGNPLQCSGSSIEGMAEVSSEGSITSSALTDMALMESSDISSEPTFSKESIVSSVTIDQGVDSDLGTPLSSEGDSSNNKCQESLVMHIDPIFAMQLQKMFGPAGFHLSPVSYYGSDLNITITADVARSIHNCWTDTLMANFKSEDEEFKKMSVVDESYARRLQEEEDAKLAAIMDSDPLGDHFPPLKTSDYDYSYLTKRENLPSKTGDLSSRIKRRQLYEMFPKVDRKALDEVFEANDGSFADTVKAVEASYCPNQLPKVVIAPEQLEEYERAMIEFAEQQSRLSELSEGDTLNDKTQDPEEVSYASLRAEACLHYELRKECFTKAKEAYSRGLLAAASYYAQQGNLYSVKFRETNKRAKETILALNNMTSKPNTLDLHMLHVQEAIDTLNRFLETKNMEFIRKGMNQMTLYIITGRGAHSAFGTPKIRPAVVDHLAKQGYSYWEASPGHVEVLLTKPGKK